MSLARHMIVNGRVQGVGFRAFVEHHAAQRNLAGWVRNRRDGSVEAVFVGEQSSVVGIINVCRTGPLGARVDGLYEREATAADLKLASSAEFSALPTA